jgi:hypothetical protein
VLEAAQISSDWAQARECFGKRVSEIGELKKEEGK